MGTCRTCGTTTVFDGRCTSCCSNALASHDDVKAERDRLAAENAELKRRLTRSVIVDELAAANATLDALRDAVPVNACDVVSYDASDYFHYLFDAIRILYPQPPETTDEPR